MRRILLPHFGHTGPFLAFAFMLLRFALGLGMLFSSSLNVESERASSISQRGCQQPLFLVYSFALFAH